MTTRRNFIKGAVAAAVAGPAVVAECAKAAPVMATGELMGFPHVAINSLTILGKPGASKFEVIRNGTSRFFPTDWQALEACHGGEDLIVHGDRIALPGQDAARLKELAPPDNTL